MRLFKHKESKSDPSIATRFEDPVGYLAELGIEAELIDCVAQPLAAAA